jgi:YD repeat-containing protein
MPVTGFFEQDTATARYCHVRTVSVMNAQNKSMFAYIQFNEKGHPVSVFDQLGHTQYLYNEYGKRSAAVFRPQYFLCDTNKLAARVDCTFIFYGSPGDRVEIKRSYVTGAQRNAHNDGINQGYYKKLWSQFTLTTPIAICWTWGVKPVKQPPVDSTKLYVLNTRFKTDHTDTAYYLVETNTKEFRNGQVYKERTEKEEDYAFVPPTIINWGNSWSMPFGPIYDPSYHSFSYDSNGLLTEDIFHILQQIAPDYSNPSQQLLGPQYKEVKTYPIYTYSYTYY